MMQKKCFYCGSIELKKSGTKDGKQRYFCKTCKKRFVERNNINFNELYRDYLYNKQSVKQLSDKYKVSTRTILRKLHQKVSECLQIQTKQEVILLMDATYRNRRSAFLSLKCNMPYLWIWYDNIELKIPPTNNGIEGLFTDLKTHMRLHNGMTEEHQKVFINQFFMMKNSNK